MIEAIEAAYQIYQQEATSRTWLLIPMFVLAFAIAGPPALQMSGKMSEVKMRTCMKYLAVGFFVYIAVVIAVLVDGMQYFAAVEDKVYEHVDSLNCQEKLNYIKSILLEKPEYITENIKENIEDDFFNKCGDLE